MVRVNNTKAMVEAALMSALIVLMSIASNYLVIANTLCIALAPVIIAIMYYRNGFKYGLSCAVVSGILSSMLLNPVSGIVMAVMYTLGGMALGYSISKGYSPQKTLIILVFFASIALVAEVVINAFFMGIYNPIEFINQQITSFTDMMTESMNNMKSMAEGLGMPSESVSMLDMYSAGININTFKMVLPGGIIASAFVEGCLWLKVLEVISKKVMRKDFPSLQISNIYVSNLVGAGLISAICVCILIAGRGYIVFDYIYKSLAVITVLVFILNGVCVVEYYLKYKMMMKPPVRLIVIMIITMMLPQVYIITGFVDMFLDFRKLDSHRLRKV